MVVWCCGAVVLWRCGRVVVWSCGRVVVWSCGGVLLWCCGAGANPKTIPKTIPSYSCSSIVVRCAGVHFMKLDDFPEVSNSGEAIFWFKIFGSVTW